MVSTNGQDLSELQNPLGPHTPPSSQLNEEIDNDDIDEAFGEGVTQAITTKTNQQKDNNSELNTGNLNTDQSSVDINKLIRAPPPAVSRSVIVQALYLLIENHNNKEKKIALDEYTITCRLRSRTSTSHGKEGVVVRHLNGPFNQTDHVFSASRLRDLEKRGRAKLVSSNARYEEIQQPMPMNLFTLIRVARLNFIKTIIKQVDEVCKLRVDTRIILANFNRPKCRDLRRFDSNNPNCSNLNNSFPIHPCILPSNANAEKILDQCLEGDEIELLKLICQYFFATCHQPFTYSIHNFEFEAGPERFMCECKVLATPGFTIHLPWMRPKNIIDHLPEEFRKKNPSREYYISEVKKVDLPKDEMNKCLLESDFIELLEKRAVGNSLILDTLNALVELKFVNILGPGRRIMPSASGIELMEQEYRKKIDQLDDEINIENVSGVEPNIGDAQANSASHSSLASTNTVSSVSNNNIENNYNNKNIPTPAVIPSQRNFGFRQRNLGSMHTDSDCSIRISVSDIPIQQHKFPCLPPHLKTKLSLEQQNEQQSTPSLLQQLHIGREEVLEYNQEKDNHYKISCVAPPSHRDSLYLNRTKFEREEIQNINFELDDLKKEFSGSDNPSPSKSDSINPRRLSWMATITSMPKRVWQKNITTTATTPRKINEWHSFSASKCYNSKISPLVDDDSGNYSNNKRVRFESPRPRRSVSMAPTERNNSENDVNLFNSSKSKQFSSECIKNNSINESRQRSRTPRRRSPSPERRKTSSFRDWGSKDQKRDHSYHRDRQNNNSSRYNSKPPYCSFRGTKRLSDENISPIRSFKQQLLVQQRQQQQRQSRFDNHFRGNRDKDWRDNKTKSEQSQRFLHSRYSRKNSLPPQSFVYENSRNNNLPFDRSSLFQQQSTNFKQNNNNKRGQPNCYQNQQQFMYGQQQRQINSKSRSSLCSTEDISSIPPKKGKWVWVNDVDDK